MMAANAAMTAPTIAPVGAVFFEAELETSTVPVPDGSSAVCPSEVLMNCVAVTVKLELELELGGEEFAEDDGFDIMIEEAPREDEPEVL